MGACPRQEWDAATWRRGASVKTEEARAGQVGVGCKRTVEVTNRTNGGRICGSSAAGAKVGQVTKPWAALRGCALGKLLAAWTAQAAWSAGRQVRGPLSSSLGGGLWRHHIRVGPLCHLQHDETLEEARLCAAVEWNCRSALSSLRITTTAAERTEGFKDCSVARLPPLLKCLTAHRPRH